MSKLYLPNTADTLPTAIPRKLCPSCGYKLLTEEHRKGTVLRSCICGFADSQSDILRPRYADDTRRYEALVTKEQRKQMELWAANHRRDYQRRYQIPVGLYDTLKRAGVNMKDMEPITPTIF